MSPKNKPTVLEDSRLISDPYGTRTRVTAVKGRCPRPLDEGAGWFANKSWRANEASIKPRSQEGVKGYERWIFNATTKNLSGGRMCLHERSMRGELTYETSLESAGAFASAASLLRWIAS